jgi:hypothetical protein
MASSLTLLPDLGDLNKSEIQAIPIRPDIEIEYEEDCLLLSGELGSLLDKIELNSLQSRGNFSQSNFFFSLIKF